MRTVYFRWKNLIFSCLKASIERCRSCKSGSIFFLCQKEKGDAYDCVKRSSFKNLTSGRVIIDSTCSTYEEESWILMHDGREIRYYDEDENDKYVVECEINPYKIYTNNLERV